MIRWFHFLIITLIAELVAVPAAFVLPLWCWNIWPSWCLWFATPDNPPEGDKGHVARWAGRSPYWQRVAWLLRNRAYGLKWTRLAAPMTSGRIIYGDPKINRNNGHYGLLRITMGSYWQWKYVKPIGSTGWCLMLNFGWLLDDDSKPRALFLFSPRVCKIKAK